MDVNPFYENSYSDYSQETIKNYQIPDTKLLKPGIHSKNLYYDQFPDSKQFNLGYHPRNIDQNERITQIKHHCHQNVEEVNHKPLYDQSQRHSPQKVRGKPISPTENNRQNINSNQKSTKSENDQLNLRILNEKILQLQTISLKILWWLE